MGTQKELHNRSRTGLLSSTYIVVTQQKHISDMLQPVSLQLVRDPHQLCCICSGKLICKLKNLLISHLNVIFIVFDGYK